MIHYPGEYTEALSRLEASERSPLPYAPVPYGPVPNKCNYMNWNRIMMETRQGVLPKYSILQRIDLGSQNDLVSVSDAKEYTYTLDPSFTFAKGARKSIAIRAVDIYNVIPNGQTMVTTEKFKHSFKVTVADTASSSSTDSCTITPESVTFNISNDLGLSMSNFAQALGQHILNHLRSNQSALLEVFADYYEAYYYDRTIYMTFFINGSETNAIRNVEHVTDSTDKNEKTCYWSINESSVSNYYNVKLTDTTAHKRSFDYTIADDKKSFTISFKIPKTTLDVRQASICGNINPWTKNNLIAPLTYSSDTLTKVFPWNGATEARFWFINEDGEKVRWRVVRGYIDLELIIDNSDSYAIDAH